MANSTFDFDAAKEEAAVRLSHERARLELSVFKFHKDTLEWEPVDVEPPDQGADTHSIVHYIGPGGLGATYASLRGKITWLGNLDAETRARLRTVMRHRVTLLTYEALLRDTVRDVAEDLLGAGLSMQVVGAALGVTAQRVCTLVKA